MRDSRLFQLLKKLDHKEFNQVRLFLESPFFKGSPAQLALFNDLVKFYPDFQDEKKLNKESILKRLYADQEGNGPTQFSKDRAKLTELLESYFIHKELESQTFTQKKLLIDAYESRGMANESKKALEETKKSINALENNSLKEHLLLTELNTRLFFHPETEKYTPDIDLLEEAFQHLDIYQLLSKVRMFAEQLHRSRLFNLPFQHTRLNQILQQADDLSNPVFELYRDLLRLLSTPDNFSLYAPLLQKFRLHVDALSEHDKRNIAAKLLYQANYFYEKGDLTYLDTIFDLFDLSIEKEFLTDQNKLSHTLFVNIISVAANLGKFEWIDHFRNIYAPRIAGDHRETALVLANAHVLLYQAKYEAAFSLLKSISKSHAANRTQAEILFLRVCYELALLDEDFEKKYDEELTKGIERFRHFILNHPGLYPPHKAKALYTFMDLIEALWKYALINVSDSKALEHGKNNILQRFKTAEQVYCGSWLLQKIKQL